jgi:hypothetical protein
VLSGGDLLGVYGVFPFDYLSEDYVPSTVTTYSVLQLPCKVVYMYGAKNFSRWTTWGSK